eukprot:CAMPEP_0115125264 /NCGR_PEP_ID=MMETSP0227-20121206/48916_1 /TAXON_ID=89957 /ORGANISM="Polarella glacialis, Strain CCMP 1383" /LENGTH=41 /DNA_ID= /DNA_START= /DNA_END= /DNA_ORIENTATION=
MRDDAMSVASMRRTISRSTDSSKSDRSSNAAQLSPRSVPRG